MKEVWGFRRNKTLGYISDYLAGFAELGFAVRSFLHPGELPADGKPVLILDFNFHADGYQAAVQRGVPYVPIVYDLWFVSAWDAQSFHWEKLGFKPCIGAYVFTCCPNQIRTFSLLGAYAEYLPLGVNTSRFRVRESGEAKIGVSFIGSPLHEQPNDGYLNCRKAMIAYPGPHTEKQVEMMEEIIEIQRGDLFTYRLPVIFAEVESRHGVQFGKEGKPWVRETIILQVSNHLSMIQRQEVVKALGVFGVEVYGPADWERCLPAGAVYRGYADYDSLLPEVLRDSMITVNVTKLPSWNALGPRVYEGLACGCWVLSNANRAQELAFGVEGPSVYRSLADLVDQVENTLSHPYRRYVVNVGGSREIEENHSTKVRARHIVGVLYREGAIDGLA